MTPFEQFNRVADCRYGRLIYNAHDTYIGRSIELYGEYSQPEVELFDQLLAPGCVVVEVGANIGVHTLFFAQAVGPEGRVIAFEPQRIIYQMLCGNMAINSITNVHCWNVAVGAAAGELIVPQIDYRRDNNFGGVELCDRSAGEAVQVGTLDSLNLEQCYLIKIDVEGMEEQVLRGAAGTISRLKPTLYVECDRIEKEASLLRAIDALGYAGYWHRCHLFNPQNFAGNQNNVFGNVGSRNVLCVDKAAGHQVNGLQPVDVPSAA